MCESTSVPAKAFSQCLQLPSVTNSTEFATLLLEPRPPHWHPPFGITCATALFTLVGPFQFWPTFPLFRFPKIVRFSRFSHNISTPSTSSLRYFLEILTFSKAIFFAVQDVMRSAWACISILTIKMTDSEKALEPEYDQHLEQRNGNTAVAGPKPFTKREKATRHCKKWWWVHVLILIACTLLITLPM